MRKFLVLLAFVFISLFAVKAAHAADLTVTCDSGNGPCSVSPSATPVFDESNWVPGSSVTRNITVTNNDDEACNLTLTTSVPQDGIDPSGFDSELLSEIDRVGVGNLFVDTFNVQFNQGSVGMGTVNAGGSNEYTWQATFPYSATGFQNSSLTFNFDLDFSCGVTTPNPTPTLSPAGPPHRNDESAGTTSTGSVAGAFTSFIGRVLGVSNDEEEADVLGTEGTNTPNPTPTPVGEVAGASTCNDPYIFWWLPLVVQLLVTGGYYMMIGEKKMKQTWWILPLVFAGVSQLLHTIIGCNCTSGELCKYYWVFNVGILIATWIFYMGLKADREK